MIQQFTQEYFQQLQESDRFQAIHLVSCGIGLPGWYVWNNFQTRAKGPFETADAAVAHESLLRSSSPGWFRDEE